MLASQRWAVDYGCAVPEPAPAGAYAIHWSDVAAAQWPSGTAPPVRRGPDGNGQPGQHGHGQHGHAELDGTRPARARPPLTARPTPAQ